MNSEIRLLKIPAWRRIGKNLAEAFLAKGAKASCWLTWMRKQSPGKRRTLAATAWLATSDEFEVAALMAATEALNTRLASLLNAGERR